jgi:hypothetical protein
MPYQLKKTGDDKYKVCKKDDNKKCFSKKGLSKKQASKQKIAIEISERRRHGGNRSVSKFTTGKWQSLYDMFRRMIEADTDLKKNEIIDFDTFKINFTDFYKNTDIDSKYIVEKLVKINVNAKDSLKLRNESSSDEENKNDDDLYEEYLQKVNDYNGHEGDLEPYNEETFKEKYMEIDDGNLDYDQIIGLMIENQVDEMENDYDENEGNELVRKFVIYRIDSKSDDQILSFDDLTNKKTSKLGNWNEKSTINFKELHKLYEFMVEECKKDKKKKLKAFFVDCRPVINDEHPKNEALIKAITGLCRNVTKDQTEYGWCVDKCSQETYDWNNWYDSNTFAVVAQLTNDGKIRLCAGAYVRDNITHLYIEYLCGNQAFPIFNEFRDFADPSKENRPLWPSNSTYRYLDLGSLPNYRTVQFYYNQGMLDPQSHIDYVIDNFSEIVRSGNDGEFDTPLEYAENYLRYFESGYCEPNDQYLNDIFCVTECGGSKYLFPNLKVELGKTVYEEYVSWDYLKGFANVLKNVMKYPEQWVKNRFGESSGESSEIEGSGIKGAKFYEELRSYGINPDDYLKKMKKWAKASGYDEKQLTLDNNDKNKLRIMTEQGTKHFGRVGYKDYYIYKHLEKKKEVKKGYADKMRDRFRKSHGAISKKRKLGRNSANELSLRILWHEKDDEGRKD